MNKVIHAAVAASLLASVSAFAHHPAEAIIDADTWAMIDQNLQEADSPHLDLDLDTMGSATTGAGTSGAGTSGAGGRGAAGGSGGGGGGSRGSGSGGGRR